MADDLDLLDAPAPAPAANAEAGGDQGKGGVDKPTASADGKPATGGTAADGETSEPAADAKPARKGRESKAPAAKKADADATGKTGEGKAPAKTEGADDIFDDADDQDAPAAAWPSDWREKLSGGDAKLQKRLTRFSSPEALLKAWQSMEQKLSSGEYKRAALPEDASEEEKAEWRAANGIPDAPDGYEFPTIKGHEWTDADKTVASGFLADLHAAGTPKPVAQAALAWYAKYQQQVAEQRSTIDRADAEAREDALRVEWGKDYRPHLKLAKDTFQDDEFISADLRAALAGARTADGRRLLLHPDFTRFLAERGLERRGPAGLITGEQGSRMGSRLDEIRKVRETDIDKYYADGLDKEYAEILEKMGTGSAR